MRANRTLSRRRNGSYIEAGAAPIVLEALNSPGVRVLASRQAVGRSLACIRLLGVVRLSPNPRKMGICSRRA
jgi:hypothetical protein